jgi:hypothetical protein
MKLYNKFRRIGALVAYNTVIGALYNFQAFPAQQKGFNQSVETLCSSKNININYALSNTTAKPCPTPMHIVTKA